MSDTITLTGLVGSEPRAITTGEGLAITSFRLASSQRRFDKSQDKWVDGETNWYTITAFRQLATNAAVSVKKGDRVVVSGKLKIRDWQAGDKRGINVDVEAESLGHDLTWGTAAFSRSVGPTSSGAIFSGFSGTNATSIDGGGVPTSAQLEAIVDGGAEPGWSVAGASPSRDGHESAGGSGDSVSLEGRDTEIETPF